MGAEWAGSMVSPPLTVLAVQSAGRFERSVRERKGRGRDAG